MIPSICSIFIEALYGYTVVTAPECVARLIRIKVSSITGILGDSGFAILS